MRPLICHARVCALLLSFTVAHGAAPTAAPPASGAPAEDAHAAAPAAAAPAVPERRSTEFGFAVFQQHCVSCHGNPAYERAPTPTALRSMTPERIYTALRSGVMKSVGDTLTEEDRRRVSESLAGGTVGAMGSSITASSPNRGRD